MEKNSKNIRKILIQGTILSKTHKNLQQLEREEKENKEEHKIKDN